METGLPDNNVRNIAQDSKGFIWLGTPNGLYRYDGYSYSAFRYADKGNLRLLNNNHIVAIRVQGKNVVVREQGNMYSVYDTHLNRFVEKPLAEIENLFASRKDKWITHPFIKQYRQSVVEQGGNIIEDNRGNPVVIDKTGLLWHIDKKTGETVKLRVFDEELFPLVNSHKYKVCLSPDGGQIWVSTNGCGITVYDRTEHTTKYIRQSGGLIATDYVIDMTIDNSGTVWAVNEFHGIVCLRIIKSIGENILLVPESRELRSNQVYILHQMLDSTILVANTRGEAWHAGRDMKFPQHPSAKGLDIHAVCDDRQGTWIGSRQQGLRSPDGRWYQHVENDPTSISSNNIFFLLKDKDGDLWVAGENAPLDLAVKGDDGGYKFHHFMDSHLAARVMMQDHEGKIWVGAKSGLYSFTPRELKKDRKAYQVLLAESDTHYSDVSSIFQDSRKRIWVGTIGGGVFVLEKKQFKNLTTSDGLISNEIHSIAEDDSGNIWIGTNRGLTILNPRDGRYRYIYDSGKPLQNIYSDNCVCKLPDGRMAFGTTSGIVIYSTASLAYHAKNKEHLAITKIAVNGVALEKMEDDSPLTIAPDDAEEIVLSHDQNSLTIECSMFNYFSSLRTRYSFMLEGYDENWSEPSAYNFATYKNLSPGQYVLHIKGFSDSSQEYVERQITIVVRNPWWATWWAYILYFVLFCTLGYVVYKQLSTVYQLRRRISIEKELTEYKLQFFTNISHEFRTPLTIIRVAMDHMRSVKDIPAELRQSLSNMRHSTDRMLRLINQLLEFRKMQAGKLKLSLEDTDIIAFVRDIFQNFSDLAENKNISYNFISNVKSCEMPLDRQHIDKVVYNLLSNAFKYTPSKGSIEVGVRIMDGLAVITVQDTGVGIPKEKQPELFQRFMQSSFSRESIGIGLHLTKALVEVHHGKIRFEENKPRGSRFVVELPTAPEVYQPADFLQQSDLQPVVLKQVPAYQEMMGEPMNNRHILIVEDDADVVNMLKQTLGHYFHVSIAMDGATALEILQKQEIPDLIVSDVMMPVMNGYELTRRIRSMADAQTIPIILLTALSNEDNKLKGTQAGADAYLTKPFDLRLLVSTCRQLLEQRDMLRKQKVQDNGQTIAPPEIIVEERDKKLLDAMNKWLENHISDSMLSVDDMAEAMGYRRSVFFKKVKALTGQTPAEYIKNLRMNRAAEMLREETITVAEVCYKVGISDPHYFTKVFKQQFGISPKKYQQGKRVL